MRVIVYTDSVYREDRGVVYGEIAFNLFLAGMASEVDLTVVGRLDPCAGAAYYPLPHEVQFVGLPHYESSARVRAVLVSLYRSLPRFWRAIGRADHVWLFGPFLHAFLFAALALIRRRTVVLGVRQDYRVYVRNRRPSQRWLHPVADALELSWRTLGRLCPVVVVGSELQAQYRSSRRVLSIAVSLISPADIAAGEQAASRSYDGELTILSVGRLDEEKNPLLLAGVLALLRRDDPRWRMVVCGDGPLREALADRFAELGVSGAVELRGHLPLHSGLLDLYRASHVFLHVSWTEGLPQVLTEAFASGIPVVATVVGGVPDAARGAALLVPPGDVAAAAAAVARLRSDSALRERLVSAGFDKARAQTLEGEVRRVVDFIAGADRAHRPPVGSNDRR